MIRKRGLNFVGKPKSVKLEKEYLEKEKTISTYLECKKTFFGKVKYFFKLISYVTYIQLLFIIIFLNKYELLIQFLDFPYLHSQ